MFCVEIFLTNQLDFIKKIVPLALMASESIAYSTFSLAQGLLIQSPFGLEEYFFFTTTTTSLFLTLNIQISHHLQIARLFEAGGV